MRNVFTSNGVAFAVAIGAMFVGGCRQEPQEEAVDNSIGNESIALPPLPIAEPPMDRSAVLQAVARAASAAVLGRDDSVEQRSLGGKRIEVRIRFGCAVGGGPMSPAGPFKVSFDEKKRTLRISATPDLNQTDKRAAAIGGQGVEAVQGFWMYRPWLLEAGCPVPVPENAPVESSELDQEKDGASSKKEVPAPAPMKDSDNEQAQDSKPPAVVQRVGIAHFFTNTDSRAGRRDNRAYEATKVLPEGAKPSPSGYDLVLSGRLEPVPGAKVINCRVQGPNTPPECIVSTEFDRVRIETPGTKEVVAEWST